MKTAVGGRRRVKQTKEEYKNNMFKFMIFKSGDIGEEDKRYYEEKMNEYAEKIASGYIKGKKVLIITGSGISFTSVPSMQEIMDKIIELVDKNFLNLDKSNVFKDILLDYKNANEFEKHQMQSRLLTYIQNAYMNKKNYVQENDMSPLSDVWNSFLVWLLKGSEDKSETQDYQRYLGIIQAEPSENHKMIKIMYKKMNAISLTTNFDNLLAKVFDKDENFYPIIDNKAFDSYFMSKEDDSSYIEIQSRGDAFWLECLGTRNKVCPNRYRHCFVPGQDVKVEDGKIVCNLCGSEARIYFAFPGTKEKDEEMASVVNGIWKYLANSIGSVIVIGSSMDYDPIFVEFLKELIRKRDVEVMYISRYKRDCNGQGLRDYKETYAKKATRFLFSDSLNTKNIWVRSEKTEKIIEDLILYFDSKYDDMKNKRYFYKENEIKDTNGLLDFFEKNMMSIVNPQEDYSTIETYLKQAGNAVCIDALEIESVKQMRYFSQLGLKTYWLRGKDNAYQKHNRLKHSMGVMLIATYLYLKVCDKPNREEMFFLQLASLFHDLGHLPFSHLLEEVFDEFGWIPSGESMTFNHEQHTKNLLKKLEKEDSNLQKIMENIGYSIKELQQLINGEFGKGYLDAFINSPVDCDKIEYLFSDAIFMNRGTVEDFKNFIGEYASDLSINKNDFLVIEKCSTRKFLHLIKMRGEMYDQVYLRSGLRYLEACCKLIIRTYISYACTEEDVFTSIENREKFYDYYNLSDSKIEKVIDFLETCVADMISEQKNKNIYDQVCELYVLEKMVENIKQNKTISDLMKKTVEKCLYLIKNTKGNEDIMKIEEEKILTYEITNSSIDRSMLKQLLKDAYLRFPGVILIDFVESKSSFSFGKRETRRRADGTKSATENILIKDIKQIKGKRDSQFQCLGDANQDVNKELNYSNHNYINIYRISDNLFHYMQAEDFIIHELRKAGFIDEN